MELSDYLARIGYVGPVTPTYSCLAAIHRAHAFAIPYENLDVILGRTVDFDLERIHAKLVKSPRGGWCYETHILLEWALREIGFDVVTVTAGIYRDRRGDAELGNHTALLVRLDQLYLADLGLGDGIRDPIPLVEGTYDQGSLRFRLERLSDGHWRFHNHPLALPTNFDFREDPADWTLIGRHNHIQQTDNSSALCANFVCQIMKPESVTCLTGRVLREKKASGTTKSLVSEEDFEDVLFRRFGIRDVGLQSIWPKVSARHEQLFGQQTADQIEYTGF